MRKACSKRSIKMRIYPGSISAYCLAVLAGCAGWLMVTPVRAEVRLPAIFSEHMVLAKTERVPVWGKANPQEPIRVTLANATVETIADATGRWRIELNLRGVGPGPFDLIVEGRTGSSFRTS